VSQAFIAALTAAFALATRQRIRPRR
jgi:hypothetical protein